MHGDGFKQVAYYSVHTDEIFFGIDNGEDILINTSYAIWWTPYSKKIFTDWLLGGEIIVLGDL